MFNKIFKKYGREEVKDKTLSYDDIQRIMKSQDFDIDCKLKSYNDFEKIIDSLNEEQNIDLKLEYLNDSPKENNLRNFKGLGPKFVSNIADKHFKPIKEENYFNANYKISTKNKKEEHYIEIEAGLKETQKKNIRKKKRATLEWIVSR